MSCIISLIGIAMIAIPTGIISSSFINILQHKEREVLRKELEDQEQMQSDGQPNR